jgi:hypothetical protein
MLMLRYECSYIFLWVVVLLHEMYVVLGIEIRRELWDNRWDIINLIYYVRWKQKGGSWWGDCQIPFGVVILDYGMLFLTRIYLGVCSLSRIHLLLMFIMLLSPWMAGQFMFKVILDNMILIVGRQWCMSLIRIL